MRPDITWKQLDIHHHSRNFICSNPIEKRSKNRAAMKALFKKWFRGSDPCIGIDIRRGAVAIASLTKGTFDAPRELPASFKISEFSIRGTEENPDALGSAVRVLLDAATSRFERCALVLPAKDVFSIRLHRPSDAECRDPDALLSWALPQTPFDPSEIIGRAFKIGVGEHSEKSVLLSTARRAAVDAYSEMANALSLDLDIITDRRTAVERALALHPQTAGEGIDILIDASDVPLAVYMWEGGVPVGRGTFSSSEDWIRAWLAMTLSGLGEAKGRKHVAVYGAPDLASTIRERIQDVQEPCTENHEVEVRVLSPFWFKGNELIPLATVGIAAMGADIR